MDEFFKWTVLFAAVAYVMLVFFLIYSHVSSNSIHKKTFFGASVAIYVILAYILMRWMTSVQTKQKNILIFVVMGLLVPAGLFYLSYPFSKLKFNKLDVKKIAYIFLTVYLFIMLAVFFYFNSASTQQQQQQKTPPAEVLPTPPAEVLPTPPAQPQQQQQETPAKVLPDTHPHATFPGPDSSNQTAAPPAPPAPPALPPPIIPKKTQTKQNKRTRDEIKKFLLSNHNPSSTESLYEWLKTKNKQHADQPIKTLDPSSMQTVKKDSFAETFAQYLDSYFVIFGPPPGSSFIDDINSSSIKYKLNQEKQIYNFNFNDIINFGKKLLNVAKKA